MPSLEIVINHKHHTRATVRAGVLSHATIDRVRRRLCRDPKCSCQIELLCQSGPQWCHIMQRPDGRVYVGPLSPDHTARPGDEPPPGGG